MAVRAGIKVQPSRFAALRVDSDPDSEDEWMEVMVGGKVKGKARSGGAAGQKQGADGAKPLSKSAKKRARRKKNQRGAAEVSGNRSVALAASVYSYNYSVCSGYCCSGYRCCAGQYPC